MASSDLEQFKELYKLMLEKDLDALEIKEEDFHLKLTRRQASPPAGVFHPANPSPRQAVPVSAAVPEAVPAASNVPGIEAPLAGVFYRSSSPNSSPFTREGDVVEPGQTLCIIEAMKVMNEIKAESRCRIAKIVAENGRPVTAGQILFHIEPS